MTAAAIPSPRMRGMGGGGGSPRPPSGNPVRAQSKFPNDPVLAAFNRRLTWREAELVVEALDEFIVRSRAEMRDQTGKALRAGEVWASAGRVFRYLASLARTCEEVFPNAETIARRCGLAESTVHEVKAQLQAIGVIDWRHRAEPAEETGPGRAPIRQISNLYRINELPKRLVECLRKARQAAYALELTVGRKQARVRAKAAQADAAAREAEFKAQRSKRPDLPKRELIVSGRRAAGAPTGARDSS